MLLLTVLMCSQNANTSGRTRSAGGAGGGGARGHTGIFVGGGVAVRRAQHPVGRPGHRLVHGAAPGFPPKAEGGVAVGLGKEGPVCGIAGGLGEGAVHYREGHLIASCGRGGGLDRSLEGVRAPPPEEPCDHFNVENCDAEFF